MEMDLYKSQILDGVLMVLWYKRKLYKRVSQIACVSVSIVGTKRIHSRIPGLKGEALLLEL
jgi:hypothetical protein